VPPGAVMDYAGAAAPTGWLLCDGSAVSRTTYATLFAAISTTYGSGDGTTTFNLPDARGRVGVGVGQGTGLTNRVLAATGGEETHKLTVAELAVHNHATSETPHSHTVAYTGPVGIASGGANINSIVGASSTATSSVATGLTIQNSGSGTAHNTMPPFIAWNKIIKT
jgi:microcystin-dependent protein